MADINELREKAQEAVEKIGRVLETDDTNLIDRTEQLVGTIKSLSRELAEEQYSNSYQALTNKLEKGKNLTDEEIEQVLDLMTGVASFYTQIEESIKYWRTELEEFQLELEKSANRSTFQKKDFLKLQAFCEEAEKFLPDIRNYLNFEDRVDKLESTLREGYTVEEGRILADVIRDKMLSEDR